MNYGEKSVFFIIFLLGICLIGSVYFLFFQTAPESHSKDQLPGIENKDDLEPKINKQDDLTQIDIPLTSDYDPSKVASYAAFTGKVTDAKKNPVQDATLYLFRSSNPGKYILNQNVKPLFEVKTDKNGLFKIDPIYPGGGYRLVVNHPLYSSRSFTNLAMKENEVTEHPTIILNPGIIAFGRVRDHNSKPINGAVISIINPLKRNINKPGADTEHMVRSDEKGKFSVNNINSTNFLIKAAAKGYETKLVRNQAGFSKIYKFEFNFYLENEKTITGMVADEKSNPLENARIHAVPTEIKGRVETVAYTDKEGKYTLSGLSRGSYYLSCSHDEYIPDSMKNIEAGSESILFSLERRSGISGQVLNIFDRPVTSFTIMLIRSNPATNASTTKQVKRKFSHKDGRFFFDKVDPGEYTMDVKASNYAPYKSETITVEKEIFTSDIQIKLHHGGSITGAVLDHKGDPLKKVYVRLRANNFTPTIIDKFFGCAENISGKTITTDKNGRFLIKNINPGLYQLEFGHRNYPHLRINDLEVIMDQTTDAKSLRMKAGASLVGKIYNNTNTPMPGATIEISMTGPPFRETTTADENGEFKFTNLPPGLYIISPIPLTKDGQSPFTPLAVAINNTTKEPVELFEGRTTIKNLVVHQ